MHPHTAPRPGHDPDRQVPDQASRSLHASRHRRAPGRRVPGYLLPRPDQARLRRRRLVMALLGGLTGAASTRAAGSRRA